MMCTVVSRVMVCTAILVSVGAPGTSQVYEREQPVAARRGVWISTGVGLGWDLSNPHHPDIGLGRSGYIRMGGTPTRHIRLGGELSYRFRQQEGLVTERVIVAGSGQYYPTDIAAVFLKGGVGLSVTSEDWEFAPGLVTIDGSYGMGATLGVGIDIPLTGALSITPNAEWFGTIGYVDEGEGYSLFLLALGITLQTK